MLLLATALAQLKGTVSATSANGYVNDYAGVVDSATKQQLKRRS